jgi:sugar phosphate isomerase/epimerase
MWRVPEARLAVQTYVFAKSGLDQPAILNAVRQAGFSAVEGGPSADFARACVAAGITHAGAHIALNAFPSDAELNAAKAISGVTDVVNSGVLRWGGLTAEDYRQAIPLLNEHGRRLRDLGLRLSYHNHDFEFAALPEGTTGMQLLLDGLDPSAVELCVDLGWVHIGGTDPVAFLRTHGARIGIVHLRDHDGTTWVPLGHGKLDLRGIAAEIARLPHIRRIVVEQDPHSAPAEQCRLSREWLATALNW